MTYSECDKKNQTDDKSCGGCGDDLNPKKKIMAETMPAEQAAQIAKRAKKVWGMFSLSERIIVAGALLSFVSFFLPWISISEILRDFDLEALNGLRMAEGFGWTYLHPLLMVVSLGLIYFSQGVSNFSKILLTRWQIVIGTVFTFMGVLGIVIFDRIIDLMTMGLRGGFRGGFGSPADNDIAIGIGWWLLTLGAKKKKAGALRLQKELLKKERE